KVGANIRLYTFQVAGKQHIGVEHKGRLVDLQAAHQACMEASGEARKGFQMPAEKITPTPKCPASR
ncbi:MAG: hypothetical protein MN733_17165, partial [Nitrososphaera sp.]|nr:hypothetical protein [Nitrososphaera sp.]